MTFWPNPKFSDKLFSVLIINLTRLNNEMQVGVKFLPLSILRKSRCRPKNPKIGAFFINIIDTILAIEVMQVTSQALVRWRFSHFGRNESYFFFIIPYLLLSCYYKLL